MNVEILNKTYEVVEEIKNHPSYQFLIDSKKKMIEDKELQELIATFKKWNQKYEEVRKYGEYHPDLHRVQLQFSKAKEELFIHPMVLEYKKHEKVIEHILNQLSKDISKAVSAKIKYKNEIGLFKK